MNQRFKVITNQTSQGPERREVPRLTLTSEQFKNSENGKVYRVTDLSERGMALHLLENDDKAFFQMDSEIEGEINILRNKYPIQATVRNLRAGGLVGLEFRVLTQSAKKAIQNLLSPEYLGKALKMIPSHEANYLWFHGPSGTDLVFHKNGTNEVRRFVLYVLGSFVQWESDRGLSTGKTIFHRATEEPHRSGELVSPEVKDVMELESAVLDSDPTPDPGKIKIAQDLVENSQIPSELQNLMIERLQG